MNTKSAVYSILLAGAIFPASQIPSIAQDAPTPPALSITPLTADLVRLAESGVDQDVMLAFVRNSAGKFSLTADAIVYLKDEGIPSPVVTEMLNHDKALNGTQPQYTYEQRAYAPTVPATPNLPPPPTTEQVPPPPPTAPATPEVPPPPQMAPTVTGPPPAYVSDAPPEVTYFYNDLSPYGTWVNLAGYGWCWQPRTLIVNREWRPYCDGGHWVWTDAGWFWQSDYSWGWAPFHYGRWHFHERVGWVWFPDTTWGPGWVVWRNEGEHCGWAPLPFRAVLDIGGGFRFNGMHVGAEFDFGLGAGLFTFIALHDFGEHDYVHRRLAPVEVNRIYSHTTIINNYVVNENHVVVNRGIPKERIEEVTHTKIKTVAVHNEPQRTLGGHEAPAMGVYKHELKTPAAPVHMVAQKVDDRHPVVQHADIVPSRGQSKPGYIPANPPRMQQPTYRSGNDNNNKPRTQNTLTPNTGHPVASTPVVPAKPAPTFNQQPYHAPPANNQTVSAPVRTYQPLPQPTPQPQPSHPVMSPQNQNTAVHSPPQNTSAHTTTQNTQVAQENNQPFYPKSFHQLGDGHTAPTPTPPALPHYQAPPPSQPAKPLPGPTLSMPVLTSPKQSGSSQQNWQQNQHGK